MKNLAKLTFAAGLFVSMAMPSMAQDGGSADADFEGNAGAILINGLSIITKQHLDFGTIAPSLTEAGTVKVYRNTNYKTECSPALTCFDPGNRARFDIIGEPNYYVTISNPDTIYIDDGAGNQMRVDNFFGAGSGNDSTWRGWAMLRNTGLTRFNVGAILHVNPNQPEGVYKGSFTLTAEYQ